jgi:hypothetical protein
MDLGFRSVWNIPPWQENADESQGRGMVIHPATRLLFVDFFVNK